MRAQTTAELAAAWKGEAANLEDELLVYDFFRREDGYDPSRPFVLCKDGGLMAVFSMAGIDPEPLDTADLEAASATLRRAFDVLNPESLEEEFSGGSFEVQTIFARRRGRAPRLARPSRDSEALRYLADSSDRYWQGRTVYSDELLWVVKFAPPQWKSQDRAKDRGWRNPVWRLRAQAEDVLLPLERLRAQAQMLRRVLRIFDEVLLGFTTRRPRMGFGLKWLDEESCMRALWRATNRRSEEPPPLRRDLPLLVQIACSERDDTGPQYAIDGRPTKVLTWKVPPATSVAYLFARLQTELRFPFTLTQIFRALRAKQITSRLGLFTRFGEALRNREYVHEAEAIGSAIRSACPWNWYFCLVVSADSVSELEDRAAKITSLLKRIQGKGIEGGEPLEERSCRFLGELSSIPGNGQYALRKHLVTSQTAADLAIAYRLSPGDDQPFMLFGDRKGGVYGYSLFSRSEPSWNKAVLGLPGSGKSVLLNSFLLGNAMVPSQGYVIDKGDSYGPVFELLEKEMPSEVAVMRLRGGDFRFNPLPLAWALEERQRRKDAGTYRLALAGGGELTCPVEDAKLFFEYWIEGLVGGGRPLEPGQKNALDRALKGKDGNAGFFRDYENQCLTYLERREKNKIAHPRPITSLLVHLQNEAPQFLPAAEFWTRKPQSRYFDTGSDSVASAKYIYFELSGLEDDPRLAVPFVTALMGSIWKRVQTPALIGERKAVLIDEAWSFLAHSAFFGAIEAMFRTIRKFNGFVALASQSPADVKDGAARRLLQTMSEVFLYRGFSEPVFCAQDLRMTEAQRAMHDGLREDDALREVMYVSNRGLNRVLAVEIPPELYWFATTDAEDKAWRNKFVGRFGLVGGIEHLVAACDGRTIAGGRLRIAKVREYAGRVGVA